jgi:purine nucleoside phosphorylase
VSAITNLAEGLGDEGLTHEQTLAAAGQAAEQLAPLVVRFVEGVGGE